MEPIRINIAVPFRVDGKAEEHPGCLRKFDARDIRRYLDALKAEIDACEEETESYLVQEIAFINGSYTHLGQDDPKKICGWIGERFRVSPNAHIRLQATPSALNFFTMNAARQLGNSLIALELPALSEKGLSDAGFVCNVKNAEAAMDSCFQNGCRSFGCVISPHCCGSAETLRTTLAAVLARHPAELRFSPALSDAELAETAPLLEAAGYQTQFPKEIWCREAPVLRRKYLTEIGFGPYAFSLFDGTPIRTTADFDFYCSHSADFEALVTHR